MDDILKDEFNSELEMIVNRCIKEVYRPTFFINMARETDYYRAAKKVVSSSRIPDGFIKLLEADRLDLSVENLVIQSKYKNIFTQKEIDTCKRRLGK